MYEGKPMALVIGGTDTGRTPIAAALLRKALGADVIVRTAGVLSHAGESAEPEAQMALEQIGIDISRHISHPLRYEEHRNADLLLAIDRGTELVLFTEFPQDPRVACLPALANMPDVLDPHRMPLGIWVAAMQQIGQQVAKAMPAIRQRLKLTDHAPHEFVPPSMERRNVVEASPLVPGTGAKVSWANDEDMQRLLGLISGTVQPNAAAASNGAAADEQDRHVAHEIPALGAAPSSQIAPAWEAEPAPEPPTTDAVEDAPAAEPTEAPFPTAPAASRPTHVERMLKLIEAAEQMPEIVHWERLRQELALRLRAVAQQAEHALDFAPAATLMIEGKLAQCSTLPNEQGLSLLRQSIARLNEAVPGSELGTIGGELAQW